MLACKVRQTHEANLRAFLTDPRSYPERPSHVRMVETHASYLVLSGRHAYKVKKNVNFGFLDFSTLAKRRHFCEREVILNRRLCTGVYLGVVPIRMQQSELTFGTSGRIVEYAVKMRRLSARYFMTRLLRAERITKTHIDVIVDRLARFYQESRTNDKLAQWGRISRLRISTAENIRQLIPFIGRTVSRAAWEAIRSYTHGFYQHHRGLFARRVREERIRDCHGDLHLDHIHLAPSQVVIYDCIEFNDRFRYIDIANDVAFLVMDFEFHGRRDLARHFTDRIARAANDQEMLALLDFYKCYRGGVRAKVESFRSLDTVSHAERIRLIARAKRYLQLALNYAVAGSEGLVVVFNGPIASGKSTLAARLSAELGWPHFSSDRVRKELAKVPLHTRCGERQRHQLYSAQMTGRTYGALTRHAVDAGRAGESVILDATFGERKYRDALRSALARKGVDFCFVEVQASPVVIKRRLAAREQTTAEISDARLADFPKLIARYTRPSEVPRTHHLNVRTNEDATATVRTILRRLAERQSRRKVADLLGKDAESIAPVFHPIADVDNLHAVRMSAAAR